MKITITDIRYYLYQQYFYILNYFDIYKYIIEYNIKRTEKNCVVL